ncbi:MAG: PepSY-like domain-containing protein [Bacteroidales bacterium]|nr:PepSY-like domain-containing protein [Bacteroidales bacterium]
MKTIRLLLLAMTIAALTAVCPLYGQKLKSDAIPEDVKQTMDFEYPNVKIQFWELKDNVYIANFKEDNSPGKCFIQKDGQWQKTVYPVPRAELPSAITDYVKNNFANYTIAVSQLQEMPNVRIHYYIEAKPEGVGYEPSVLTFNEVGSLMERHDPANFDKDAKSVVDTKMAAKPAPSSNNTASTPAGKNTASNTSKPTTTAGKPAANTGKPAATANNKPANTSANKPANPSSGKPSGTTAANKPASSTGAKPNTSSNANAKPASSSAKPASTPAKPTTTQTKPASNTAKPAISTAKPTNTNAKPAAPATDNSSKTATASNSKPKKEKEEKPVYDDRGNKAIDPNMVPAVVKTALSKKAQRPEELHWFKVDTFFVANFIAREQKNEVFITPSGLWEKTYTVIPEVSVSGNMAKHIQTYYKGYRFKNAIKETRADKKDVTMVEIYEKDNWKQKLVTTFLFDKTGKLIRTIDPNYELGGQNKESAEDVSLEKYYEKMNMSNKSDNNSQIPKDVQTAFKAKYPHASGVTWSETSDGSYTATYYGTRGKEVCVINSYGVITETMTLGNPDNLLSSIASFIKQNYKNNKVVEYYAVKKIVEKKNFYKVIIADKKTKVEQELWFTTSGKFVE